jgi:hypothetical protein
LIIWICELFPLIGILCFTYLDCDFCSVPLNLYFMFHMSGFVSLDCDFCTALLNLYSMFLMSGFDYLDSDCFFLFHLIKK